MGLGNPHKLATVFGISYIVIDHKTKPISKHQRQGCWVVAKDDRSRLRCDRAAARVADEKQGIVASRAGRGDVKDSAVVDDKATIAQVGADPERCIGICTVKDIENGPGAGHCHGSGRCEADRGKFENFAADIGRPP